MWEEIPIEGALHRRSHNIPLTTITIICPVQDLALWNLIFLQNYYNFYESQSIFHPLLCACSKGVFHHRNEMVVQLCILLRKKLIQLWGVQTTVRQKYN